MDMEPLSEKVQGSNSEGGGGKGVTSVNRQAEGRELRALYDGRFDAEDLRFKRELWEILVADYFQRFVEPGDTLVELGAGTCEFINAVRCARKIAVDLNPRTAELAREAEVLLRSSTDLSPIESGSVDVVFASNFFEHVKTKDELLEILREVHRILRPSGRIVILQPNIRYVAARYWDYFDHHLPLSHQSMAEALLIAGFRLNRVVPKFLPYSVKDRRFPRSGALVRLYLRLPAVWRIFGRQMLIVATPT
jgi:predicted SAM-dependent methyltransferase